MALGREWNQYVPLVSFEEPRQVSERLRAFSQRWQALLEESSRLEMPAEVSNSRDLLAEHFQAMGQAMDYLLGGEVTLANSALATGNDLAAQAGIALHAAVSQYTWLTCS